MNQHGGGYIPESANMSHGNSQAHGGAYVPGQHTQALTYTSAPQSSQQYYPPHQQQAKYQSPRPPQQPVYQSQGISTGGSPYPQQSGFVKSKSEAFTSAAEVDEYNNALVHKRPIHLKGILHFFDPETRYRFKGPPHLYRLPAFQYNDPQSYRHRDSMDRVLTTPADDRYLSPFDGHLAKLHVQATDPLYVGQGTTTWRRTYIRNVAPMNVRIATWPIDFSVDPQSWADWGMILLRFIPASIALTIFVLGNDSVEEKYGLKYAPLPYKFHGYAKVARNQLENARKSGSPRVIEPPNTINQRLLRPRYLCFLKNPDDDKLQGAVPMLLSTWQSQNQHGTDKVLSYLFVAYSTEQFSHGSAEDMEALHYMAERATRDAKLPAYWIACSCMPDRDQLEEDVYRISDIMRGAEAMAIAVGSPSGSASAGTTEDLLRQWGRRMWTFPEVLLSQNNHVKVYTRKGKLDTPLHIPKKQFAAQVWTDATVSRQLIDNYEGNLQLSRLELVILALECLQSRQTVAYLQGDHSYALMGLLRLRPNIDHTDTAFQAFARLSLMNDSDLLLERLVCTMPKSPSQPWYNMDDAYGSSLWDIYPTCQVAGVADGDTVIIDGAYGTSIRWKSFHQIWSVKRLSWRRWLAWKLLHASSAFVIIGFSLIGAGASGPPGTGGTSIGIGFIMLLLGASGWLMAPRLLRVILGGKFWYTQAAVFGFEGYLNLPTIERSIFGGNFERLKWSSNGSPLSRHRKNEFGECVGVDPTDDIDVRNLVEKATTAGPGDQRIFTLVDTFSMEVTLFEAARPPIALVICGCEGGMQRAIGCSYDWTTGTLYRETVLRMQTTILDRMDRVNKMKFGLRRSNTPVCPRPTN